jgi:hypothetical protein
MAVGVNRKPEYRCNALPNDTLDRGSDLAL